MIMTCEYAPKALHGILTSLKTNIAKQLDAKHTVDLALLMLHMGVHMVMVQKRYSIDSALLMSGITTLMNKEFVDKLMQMPRNIVIGRGETSDVESFVYEFIRDNNTLLDVSKFLDFMLSDQLGSEQFYKWIKLFTGRANEKTYIGSKLDQWFSSPFSFDYAGFVPNDAPFFGLIYDLRRDALISSIRDWIEMDLQQNANSINNSKLYKLLSALIIKGDSSTVYWSSTLYNIKRVLVDTLKINCLKGKDKYSEFINMILCLEEPKQVEYDEHEVMLNIFDQGNSMFKIF